MRAVDLIQKKKQGLSHTKEEIYFMVNGYTKGTIPDYQMSAWLMAICFNKMDDEETAYMTQSFIESGDVLDFSDISPCIADKHSTGGVGDKATICLIPILMALDINCAKLSGRGLGFTGGTIDKLESIPNFKVELTNEEFIGQIKKIGAAISSQSPNLTPADGKIYALRDVTATVDNKSLICASVVSKKIASGATSVVLDIKFGKGAFIKTLKEAKELGELMVKTGALLNKKIDCIISSMDEPLGQTVGNGLEIIESIEFLKGNYKKDLYDVTVALASKTLLNCNKAKDIIEAHKKIDEVINNGSALNKLKELIIAQKGNCNVINDYSLLNKAKNKLEIKAGNNGFVNSLDALKIAHGAKLLKAGRDKKQDKIDYDAGIKLNKKTGDKVQKGETLLTLFYNDVENTRLDEAVKDCFEAYIIKENKPEEFKVLYD